MAASSEVTVLTVRHWNESLFSFTTTRDPSLRFRNILSLSGGRDQIFQITVTVRERGRGRER